LDAIHSGELADAEYESLEIFNLSIPKAVSGVPSELLNPKSAWNGTPEQFNESLRNVGNMFVDNFRTYEDEAAPETLAAGPKL
jgi:phosphoenolpyruvate carboxykinase (ATP)